MKCMWMWFTTNYCMAGEWVSVERKCKCMQLRMLLSLFLLHWIKELEIGCWCAARVWRNSVRPLMVRARVCERERRRLEYVLVACVCVWITYGLRTENVSDMITWERSNRSIEWILKLILNSKFHWVNWISSRLLLMSMSTCPSTKQRKNTKMLEVNSTFDMLLTYKGIVWNIENHFQWFSFLQNTEYSSPLRTIEKLQNSTNT